MTIDEAIEVSRQMTVISQVGDYVHSVLVVSDTPTAKIYRVTAGKWPKVEYSDERSAYPVPTAATPNYHRWKHGDATMILLLREDGDPTQRGAVEFHDDDAGGEWLVAAHKRCVWVVLVRDAPPRPTGME